MNETIATLGKDYPDLIPCLPQVEQAYELLAASFSKGGKLLVCGNGGSAADADHIVGELMKGFLLKRAIPAPFRDQLEKEHAADGRYIAAGLQGALPAIALGAHTALATAFSNDVAPDLVFAQQVYAYGRPDDALIGISTSGRSANVLHALRVARSLGVRTIGFTGSVGEGMAALCDTCIRAPSRETPRIQERHLPIYHSLCIALEKHFFGPDRS